MADQIMAEGKAQKARPFTANIVVAMGNIAHGVIGAWFCVRRTVEGYYSYRDISRSRDHPAENLPQMVLARRRNCGFSDYRLDFPAR